MKQKIQGSALLLLATIVWGASFVSQSVGMDHVGPYTFQAIRCAMAVIGLLPVIWLFDRRKQDGKTYVRRFLDKKLWIAGLCCGIPLFFAVNLQQLGIVTTDAGKSAFITAMYIVFVPFVGILFRQKPTLASDIGVALAVVGLYFLSCMGATSINMGDVLTLICAVCFAFQICFVDKYAPGVDPLRLNCLQAFVCTVGSTILMLLVESPTLAGIQGSWWPMCYSGFLSMGLAYSLQILGQQKLEPMVASLIMSLESVVAVLCGWLFLRQTLTQWEILGCVLVFCAVILSQIPITIKRR